jgi:hypothetical protein
MTLCCRSLPACFLLLVGAGAAAADNWPQWRGPTNDGVSKETGLPTQFGAEKNLAWLLPLPGMGGSTPVVWGERIFLTSEHGNDLVLLCVGTDGKERWKRKVGTATAKVRRDEGNGASASPSTDGKHVWAFVASGELACFDLEGNEVWKFNTQDRYGKFRIQFGLHSTPLLDGDRLYLQLIHSGGAWVVAIDKVTGKDIWKVARKSDGHDECEHSYASPALWRNGKDAFLIVHGNDYATGHALDDGRELWRVGGLNPKNRYNPTLRFISTPVASPELIVIPSAKKGPTVGLKPNATGMVEAGSPFEQWRRPSNTPDVSSPLIHERPRLPVRRGRFPDVRGREDGRGVLPAAHPQRPLPRLAGLRRRPRLPDSARRHDHGRQDGKEVRGGGGQQGARRSVGVAGDFQRPHLHPRLRHAVRV